MAASATSSLAGTDPPAAVELPSNWSSQLWLPALLILLGSLMGGLRTLVASPLRHAILDALSERRRAQVEPNLQSPLPLGITAGMLRALCVFGAAGSLWPLLTGIENPWLQALVWVAVGLVAALFLEGVPSMVARGRLLGPVLASLPVVKLLAWPLRPFSYLLQTVLHRVGSDPASAASRALLRELSVLARDSEHSGRLGDNERRMIGRVFDLPQTDASEVMTPRTAITAVADQATLSEVLQLAKQEGHSRIPVYREDLDHVVGVFYLKDVLAGLEQGEPWLSVKVGDHMREPYFVPETMGCLALMNQMRQRRVHLAVVVDEYGGTSGVITIEDLVEEIVGEIEDEHDPEGESPSLREVGPGEILVDGRYPIDELNESFSASLPEDEFYDTVAGLLCDRFGYIPSPGESLRVNGLLLEVIEADDRKVAQVRIQRQGPATPEADAA